MPFSPLSLSFTEPAVKINDTFREGYESKEQMESQWHFNVSLYTKEATVNEPLITKDFETGELEIARFYEREEIDMIIDIKKHFTSEGAMRHRHPELYGEVSNGSGETRMRFPDLNLDCPKDVEAHRKYVEQEHTRRRNQELQRMVQKIGGMQAAKKDMDKPIDLPDISKFDAPAEALARRIYEGITEGLESRLSKRMALRHRPAAVRRSA